MGQIRIQPLQRGFDLRHHEDEGRSDLQVHTSPSAARHLARLDRAGRFRPLKTAPNLRRGWRLIVEDFPGLRAALDYFYPAMLGVALSHERGELVAVPLRATLRRQTGMYRVTQKITDSQAGALIRETCRSDGGCLKTILWRLDENRAITTLPPQKFDPHHHQPGTGTPAIPLLCHEACNLLVAGARAVVKGLPVLQE